MAQDCPVRNAGVRILIPRHISQLESKREKDRQKSQLIGSQLLKIPVLVGLLQGGDRDNLRCPQQSLISSGTVRVCNFTWWWQNKDGKIVSLLARARSVF